MTQETLQIHRSSRLGRKEADPILTDDRKRHLPMELIPIGFMYGIFTYIYHIHLWYIYLQVTIKINHSCREIYQSHGSDLNGFVIFFGRYMDWVVKHYKVMKITWLYYVILIPQIVSLQKAHHEKVSLSPPFPGFLLVANWRFGLASPSLERVKDPSGDCYGEEGRQP